MLRLIAFVALVAVVPSAPDGGWRWPVDDSRALVRGYVAPATPYGAGHRGIDIRAPSGVLRSPADGVVHFAGYVVDRPVLSIRHGAGVISSYEPVTASVSAGDLVQRGDVVGTIEPGHCADPCVHMGVRVHGQYVSPLNWLGGIPPSVLLPTRRSRQQRTASFRCAPRRRPRSRDPATRTSPPR